MASKYNSVPMRVDPEMQDLINDFARKNDISRPLATKKLAKIIKGNLNGKKVNLIEEIIF